MVRFRSRDRDVALKFVFWLNDLTAFVSPGIFGDMMCQSIFVRIDIEDQMRQIKRMMGATFVAAAARDFTLWQWSHRTAPL
jgi:hypothetical protein